MNENLIHFLVSIAATTSTALLLVLATASAPLHFMPIPRQYRLDGFSFTRLVFKHGPNRTSFEPPPNWSYRGSVGELRLTPPGKPFAEGVIQAREPSTSQGFTGDAKQALIARVLSELPPGSQAPAVEREAENTLWLGAGPSYELVISYQALGERFLRSVIVINRRQNELMFRFSARQSDFEGLNKIFRRSLSTFRWSDRAVIATQP